MLGAPGVWGLKITFTFHLTTTIKTLMQFLFLPAFRIHLV